MPQPFVKRETLSWESESKNDDRLRQLNERPRQAARRASQKIDRRGWISEVIAAAKRCAVAMQSCSNAELQVHNRRLRAFAAQQNRDADEQHQLVLAAGAVCEAVRRTLGITLFDEQLHAGIVMSCGAVAEMQTGEGKTFSLVLPAYVRSLAGRGVHVATTNAYLAQRDQATLSPVFQCLGVTTGLLKTGVTRTETQNAYRADITYGPGYAFGFDYLKDQLTLDQVQQSRLGGRVLNHLAGTDVHSRLLQRGLHSAIVDEVDHVLLDDAVSPLILTFSSNDEAPDAEIHRRALSLAKSLKASQDFQVSGRKVDLTDHGFQVVYEHSAWAFDDALIRPWHEYVELALRAAYLFQRDIDYVIRDGRVQIVDPATGRLFEDRRWSDGLHQAIEASESMQIHAEQASEAKITRQRFYRYYEFLAGTTGTARGVESEFAYVYGLPVAIVPLRSGSRRQLLAEHHSLSRAEKMQAIACECAEMVSQGRSVLIGTLSIAESLDVAAELRRHGLSFEMLNGVQDADEAAVVAKAGQPGVITVATNLAGRGTDIKLHAAVAERGGLHVIVSQPHALSRVDRQLVGRSARCGDPGSARVFYCAEDPPAKDEAPWIRRALERWDSRGRIDDLQLTARVERLQRLNQQRATAQRRQLLCEDQEHERLMHRNDPPGYCCQIA